MRVVGSGREVVEWICLGVSAEKDRSGELSSEGKLSSWSTTWPPRKPQPPNTRTVPRDLEGGVFDIVVFEVVVAVLHFQREAKRHCTI